MSRIGKMPVELPSGVTIALENGKVVVNGPKGRLDQSVLEGVNIKLDQNTVTFERVDDRPANRAKHGLMRALVNNMVVGVSQGFSKKLEINGVGYRVALAGTNLKLNVGFSHDVMFTIPSGVTATVEQNVITISGVDKQQVGQVAAELRAIKKPEPYKGKGIKYVGEKIIRKSGKSGKEK